MNRIEAAPGVFVTALPGEKFKRSYLSVNLVLPGRRQDATALAVLPHVLERRCAAIPDATRLARHLYDLYGASLSCDSFVLGGNRVVSLNVSGLKNEFALGGEDLAAEYLRLVCELLFAPLLAGGVFDAEDVEIEKNKQAEFLRSEMNDKRTYCLRQARRKLFGSSPLGLETGGYLEDIPALTPAALHAAYTDLLARAQVEVVACGIDATAAGQAVAGRLAAFTRRPAAPLPPGTIPVPGGFAHHSEAMDTAQGKLCLLFGAGETFDEKGDTVMQVAAAVLGGLPSSRLFMNVREKQSLCYYCSSGYNPFTGVLAVDSGVAHEKAALAETAILHEVEQLQAADVTEEELQFAKSALQTSLSAVKDNPYALLNWVLTESLRGRTASLDRAAALVQQISAQEVREALAAFRPALQYLITGKEAC